MVATEVNGVVVVARTLQELQDERAAAKER